MNPPDKPIRPQKPVKPVPRPTTNAGVNQTASIVKVSQPQVSIAPSDQPISPPTEPLQYRAIGLVKGRYVPSAEAITRGQLIMADGSTIETSLLGKLISIIKKRLDMNLEYLWVVYPRTQEKEGRVNLFLQIAGVWAPEAMGKTHQSSDPGVPDGYFSVRGEVVKQSEGDGLITVKIRRLGLIKKEKDQELSKNNQKRPYNRFKLHLWGILPRNAVGYFWNLNVRREGTKLTIVDGEAIAPIKKFSRKPAGGSQKPRKPSTSGTPNRDTPRPNLRPRPPQL